MRSDAEAGAPSGPAAGPAGSPGRPGARDPLETLAVLDRLEVGPVELEARRLVAPYTVTRPDGGTDTARLIYRYEEDVFEPGSTGDVNLASAIAAQVALNYGLFCREIVLRGPLDEADRRFLVEMAANTAREIYVKKFLEENPFLTGPAASLPAVKRTRYLRAELVFPDATGRASGAPPWGSAGSPARERVAVLASGGKDSLLSYGLLRELGYETHSIFVNESGRHWYTALNAYRHLSEADPAGTARVWTTSDRLFAWMLRQLPFVRPDFARVRSDEYPIRLWTVAVFLFGALPVARRRGVGRLVIGDEYDTSRRATHRGVPHYDGLYDQSRWFDDALGRYYRRKGWPLSQFSILRPLSELLIQKTLVERYPDLQRHQVSCHAASLDGDRVRPCGRCEKCRRIVGMLVALGADPSACGYTEAQVRGCLEALAEQGVHQESAGEAQLGWMLARKGLIPDDAPGFTRRAERPEILRLRFHDEHAPPDGIPSELREPLWTRLLEHAEGAVLRRGRVWAEFDPLSPDILARPYRLERAGPTRGGGAGGTGAGVAGGGPGGRGESDAASGARAPGEEPGGRRRERRAGSGALQSRGAEHLLSLMTWPRARERFRETDTALLPVGAIEQHGPHLPLDTDAWDADYTCRCVAERCSDPQPLVLPLIPYGVSYHHADFPGTLSVSPRTLSRLVYEVGMSAARHGIIKLVIVNGHGGNAPSLQFAAQMINRDAHIFTCVDTGETSDTDIAAIAETPDDAHAGEIETSTTLATRPELVDLDAAESFVPDYPSQYLSHASGRGVPWFAHTGRISSSGVLGDPTRSSREKGEKFWELMIEHLTRFVEALKQMSLDEIHEKEL